jgi:hypothetical protein
MGAVYRAEPSWKRTTANLGGNQSGGGLCFGSEFQVRPSAYLRKLLTRQNVLGEGHAISRRPPTSRPNCELGGW